MDTKKKVVARMKSGEVIKGYMSEKELQNFVERGAGYCEVINHHNTEAIYISPSHVSGLFIVKSFEGKQPSSSQKFYFSLKSIIQKNLPLITSTATVAFLSIAGLIFLL